MPDSPSPPRRVTIRDIAAAAGVSIMTVSLALRNHPRISPATTERVKAVAEKLGYRPDPEIVRLMTLLHQGREAAQSPTLALVDLSPYRLPPGSENYCEQVRRGAIARAEALGYIPTSFHQLDYDGDLQRLLGVIHYRGIRGILLLPPLSPVVLPPDLDWSPFSVLAATYAISPLEFHRVVPHQFIDMCRLLQILEQKGHQRIGAIFGENFERRIHYHFTAAFALKKHDSRIYRIPDGCPIEKAPFEAWLHQHRPDVIIAGNAEEVLAALPQAKGSFHPPEVVSFRSTRHPNIAYWDERPCEIGSVAASLLAGMVQHHETGIPDLPRTSMIHGFFQGLDDSATGAKTKESPAKSAHKTKVALRCDTGK